MAQLPTTGKDLSESGIYPEEELPRASEKETRFWCHLVPGTKPYFCATVTLDFSVKSTNKFLLGLTQLRLLFGHYY